MQILARYHANGGHIRDPLVVFEWTREFKTKTLLSLIIYPFATSLSFSCVTFHRNSTCPSARARDLENDFLVDLIQVPRK